MKPNLLMLLPLNKIFDFYDINLDVHHLSVFFLCQPRILMAMARDGLLPPFFSDVNKRTQVPVKGTIVTGVIAATLAFFMDVSELAGMVSVQLL